MTMAGYGIDYVTSTTGSPVAPYKVAIPLERLAPIFNPLKKQLMPPQLASGLHIEIVFEDLGTAFKSTDSLTTPTMDISNIHFLLDQVDLSDEAQKAIAVESALGRMRVGNPNRLCPRVPSIKAMIGTMNAPQNTAIKTPQPDVSKS